MKVRYTRATRIWSSRHQHNVFAPNGTNPSASIVFTIKVAFNVWLIFTTNVPIATSTSCTGRAYCRCYCADRSLVYQLFGLKYIPGFIVVCRKLIGGRNTTSVCIIKTRTKWTFSFMCWWKCAQLTRMFTLWQSHVVWPITNTDVLSFQKIPVRSPSVCETAETGMRSVSLGYIYIYTYARKLSTIGSDNGLSPGRRQAIIWTTARIMLIEPLGTNFSEMLIEIPTFSFKKMRLKMSSGKWRPFCVKQKLFRSCQMQDLNQCWCIIKLTLRNELRIEIQYNDVMDMRLKMSSAECWPFFQASMYQNVSTMYVTIPAGMSWSGNPGCSWSTRQDTWIFSSMTRPRQIESMTIGIRSTKRNSGRITVTSSVCLTIFSG